jgi:hypothetical protein
VIRLRPMTGIANSRYIIERGGTVDRVGTPEPGACSVLCLDYCKIQNVI